MKLVDILARELKVWPEELGDAVGQAHDGKLHNEHGDFIERTDQSYTLCESFLVEVVTRAEWQAAVDALKGAESAVPFWSGPEDGLPPVGTVCENVTGDHWNKCLVIAHDAYDGKEWAAFRFVGEGHASYYGDPANKFRPIRTPEQIAAYEREKAVAEMNSLVGDIERIPTWSDALGVLYDAGYRLQVKP